MPTSKPPLAALRIAISVLTAVAVFLLFNLSAEAQQERILYRFSGNSDGMNPYNGLITDSNGNLYGDTLSPATVFEISPPKSLGGQWTRTVLHRFEAAADGQGVVSVLTLDTAGNLYGATSGGGSHSVGVIFELVPPSSPGSSWTENILHSFDSTDGKNPYGGVIFDKQGNLYGTTDGDFNGNYGNVFQLSPPASLGQPWTETILYQFQGTTDGCGPQGKLLLGKDGSLYGTAVQCGGTQGNCFFGCGTIFKVSPPAQQGDPWTETTLFQFHGADGEYPKNGLAHDAAWNLYGATSYGGNCDAGLPPGCGEVFELSPPTKAGQAWTESIVYNFTNGSDGSAPQAGVIVDNAGNLFGTTVFGGDSSCGSGSGCGTVFELSPPTSGTISWTETTLHIFDAGLDGNTPIGGLVIGLGQALYGVTETGGGCSFTSIGCGTVFEVVP